MLTRTRLGVITTAMVLAQAAVADTLTVGPNLVDFDHITINAAIVAAADGDEIVVEPDLYPENLVINNKDITIRRLDTPGEVIIFGQGIGGVFEIISSSVTLRGLTITGGQTANDAGIRAETPSVLTVEDCVIEDNHATSTTGGVYAGARLTMRNTIVRNNTSPTAAGGVYLRGSGPHLIESCLFENNDAGTTDASPDEGGALVVDTASQVRVVETTFRENSSTWRGGAVATLQSSDLRFDRCTFESNTSPHSSAIWISDADAARANNCLFVNNVATAFGGVVYNEQLFECVNCTFVGNTDSSANNSFQGVRTDSQTALLNCIVVNPSAGSHGGSGIFTPRHSLIPEGGATPDVNGNFDADPMFVDAPGGDFRLMGGSPAIDAGDSLGKLPTSSASVSVLTLDVDFDGDVRNLDDPNTPNTGVPAWELNIDLGAYEFQPGGSVVPGCNVADLAIPYDVLDFSDVIAFLTAFGAGCP